MCEPHNSLCRMPGEGQEPNNICFTSNKARLVLPARSSHIRWGAAGELPAPGNGGCPLQLFQGVSQEGQAESKGTTGKTHLHHPLKNNSTNTAQAHQPQHTPATELSGFHVITSSSAKTLTRCSTAIWCSHLPTALHFQMAPGGVRTSPAHPTPRISLLETFHQSLTPGEPSVRTRRGRAWH